MHWLVGEIPEPRRGRARSTFGQLVLVMLLALATSPAIAQAPEPDPLRADTLTAAYLWREVVYTSEAGRSDGWGGRFVAQLGLGRLGLTVRGDVGGLPGEFSPEDPQTFASASGYVAAHYNLVGRPGAALGPTAFVGRAISLEADGSALAPTPGAITAALGVRVGAPGAAGYLALGTHEALGGLCVLGTAHLPVTSRLAFVVDGAASRDGRAYVRLGVAVTLATGGNR